MLSPIFTSGKLKAIMPTVNAVTDDFGKYLKNLPNKDDVEVKEMMQLCTCEILGMIGCGVKPNILENPKENVFYKQVQLKSFLHANASAKLIFFRC